MPVHLRHPARTLLSRLLPLFALILAICGMAPVASAQTDPVNMSVWKMIYGVTDAQAGSGAWLAADDDGDGVSNGSELAAGTNPFKANSTVVVTRITTTSTTVSLTFPTVPDKLYTVQATPSLNPTGWSPVAGVFVVGDGTPKTLVPPKGSNKYFRVVVQDQSSAGDSVSDWAKQFLGYALGSSIGSQSIYNDPTSLNAALTAQMVVTVAATAPTTTQPATNTVPTSGLGEFTITRSGYFLLSQITVPITAGGTAVPGTDYVALPASVTFLAG